MKRNERKLKDGIAREEGEEAADGAESERESENAERNDAEKKNGKRKAKRKRNNVEIISGRNRIEVD